VTARKLRAPAAVVDMASRRPTATACAGEVAGTTPKHEPGTYGFVPAALASDLELTGTALRVGMFLAIHANKRGECWKSTQTMSAMLGIPRSSVIKGLRQLVEREHVTRRRRSADGRGQTSSLYTLVFTKPAWSGGGAASPDPVTTPAGHRPVEECGPGDHSSRSPAYGEVGPGDHSEPHPVTAKRGHDHYLNSIENLTVAARARVDGSEAPFTNDKFHVTRTAASNQAASSDPSNGNAKRVASIQHEAIQGSQAATGGASSAPPDPNRQETDDMATFENHLREFKVYTGKTYPEMKAIASDWIRKFQGAGVGKLKAVEIVADAARRTPRGNYLLEAFNERLTKRLAEELAKAPLPRDDARTPPPGAPSAGADPAGDDESSSEANGRAALL